MALSRVAQFLIFCAGLSAQAQYTPDWASLDKRPLPEWYDKAKFGIFVHWGIFSVPAWGTEWYWWYLNGKGWDAPKPEFKEFHELMYGKHFSYVDFARQFHGKLFDADRWADLFQRSGAKYVVLTAKHHEGFTMWPSKFSANWNAQDIGPHRDVVAEVTEAVRRRGMTMGLYHSLFEWFNTMYLEDKASKFASRRFVEWKVLPELREMVETYKPDLIWSDGDWEVNDTYWGSRDFLTWLYNESPVRDTVVTNDRWGFGNSLKHGDYYTGVDRQQAGENLLGHKWEQSTTIDILSWGFTRDSPLSQYLSATEILQQLSSTVAYGGNMLLNVGPTADGVITPIYEERLLQVGRFLKINGEAIYETTPWMVQNETGIQGAYYTYKPASGAVFLMVVQNSTTWPPPGTPLELKALRTFETAELLTAAGPMPVECPFNNGTDAFLYCYSPCPFQAGLAKGAVDPLGFVLRLTGAEAFNAEDVGTEV